MDVTLGAAWDPAWDQVFASRAWGRYPSEELVAFMSHAFGGAADRGAFQLLEIGCGTGANIWFLAREGYRAAGIDGSIVGIRRASERLAAEGLQADLRQGDLIALPFLADTFDLVFDIAVVQHNTRPHRTRIMQEVRRVLKPGGRMLATLIAAGSWGEGTQPEIEPGTYSSVSEGPGVGCGTIHFFQEQELPEHFEGFSVFSYERREYTRQNRTKHVASWIVTAVK